METIAEQRRCSACARMRLVEMLKEGRKNSVKCAEKKKERMGKQTRTSIRKTTKSKRTAKDQKR